MEPVSDDWCVYTLLAIYFVKLSETEASSFDVLSKLKSSGKQCFFVQIWGSWAKLSLVVSFEKTWNVVDNN